MNFQTEIETFIAFCNASQIISIFSNNYCQLTEKLSSSSVH